ncbi:HAMP domain-containing histidine kinase [Leucobacter allii]|uniref:histidine kinase n=1 Tax=Leucobacter allii TaxID=2932247 RepID=A0ABY4FRV2_9MICO|nr:HAMP domain-containing sensor histidine kinase [Leucobacter allii]UOQ58899.1 HAMP domain-containing histidine kinase [Leucobacter allii]UOR03392.1 HAMP domain-containing histidine kinase [Leucobacter allii]
MVSGGLLLAVVYVFLLRYVPPDATPTPGGFVPGRDDLVRAFVPAAAWAFCGLLAAGLFGGWLLAGRMLAPLTRITRAARAASAGSLSHRIELPGRQDEFRELADSFDAMLGRLERQLAEQQRFAANASHELRTPLAITQTLLEVAESDPDAPRTELLARLREVNARAIRLTEALLALSRADQRVFVPEPVDLSLTAEEAAEALLPLAERRGIALEVAGDAAVAPGSPELLLQLVTNLVQNAIVHNVAGGFVRVSTASADGAATLHVENSGEPVPAEAVATLAEPFRRGAERVRGEHQGVGLGLAIVRSIVRAHDGELRLAARGDGGLDVRVALPLRASALGEESAQQGR